MRGAAMATMALALSPTAPAPLSQDHSPAVVDSSYGSGNFGRWGVDEFNLPRFRYSLDETTDPRAKQPELAGATLAQHQVGNDHIKGMAFNDGYTQFWSQDREPQWANLFDAADRHYSGGYGFLDTSSTAYADRKAGVRDFGVGYARRATDAGGLSVDEHVYAPFGDDPVLLHDVTIKNTSSTARSASWFEYWDVNPYYQTTGFQRNIAMDAPAWDAASKTLSVAQTGVPEADTDPLSIFAVALRGPVADHTTSVKAFFGDGTRALPAAVKAGRLDDSMAGPTADGQVGDVLFAMRAPVELAPGASVTLRYAYGMEHARNVTKLVTKLRGQDDPFGDSERAWSDYLPRADLGADNVWVSRELAWDAYLLRSASVYEEVCGHHTITQGGYYQYVNGANLGYRSWLHYLLPIAYSDPELAREILRYAIQWQPEAGGQNPYGTGPLCQRVDLGTSNDLDFWLLLAAGEYGLGTRDTTFFDEQLTYYDTKRKASAWQHLKDAFAHQESLLGPHGGYVMGSTGDWSDFSTQFLQATESMLVTAQLAYAYPKLAELADLRGDADFARQLRAAGARNVATLKREWVGKGWYSRAYSGDKQVGTGVLFEEPQPWALLAGAASPSQQATLLTNIRRFLGGVGAPHGPAAFGSTQVPGRGDPDVTETGPNTDAALENAPLQGAAEWPGGVWFDLNGHLVWAYAALDQREAAWDEYTRNTLARHATLWPDHWDGTISVDDVCYGYYSDHPSYCGNGLTTAYQGQITEQPTWMVMNAIRLAGVTPERDGLRIAPHFPFAKFSVRFPQIGVAADDGVLRGYFRPEQSGDVVLHARVPEGAGAVTAWANGKRVPHRLDGDEAVFTIPGTKGRATDWAVTRAQPYVCVSRRSFTIHVRGLRGARVTIAGRRVRVRRGAARVDLRGRPKERVAVRITGVNRRGKRVTQTRRYRLCVARQSRLRR